MQSLLSLGFAALFGFIAIYAQYGLLEGERLPWYVLLAIVWLVGYLSWKIRKYIDKRSEQEASMQRFE